MRFDPQKSFPYPVLRPDVDDYIDGEFQTTVVFEGQDNGTIKVLVTFALSVPEIQAQIENGSAAFVIVIACRDTYFREAYAFAGSEHELLFNDGQFRGQVAAYPFVVAKADINGFHCADINKEYGSELYDFEVGEVLAIDEPRIVYIDRDLFKPVSSVFEMVMSESLTGFEWQLSFDQDKARIKVSAAAKQVLDRARNATKNRAVLLNSLYFSAVMQAIQYLKETTEYDDYAWARVIRHQCHNHALDIESHDSYLLAEKLMDTPLHLLHEYLFKEAEQ